MQCLRWVLFLNRPTPPQSMCPCSSCRVKETSCHVLIWPNTAQGNFAQLSGDVAQLRATQGTP
eukprot:11853511-Alexandrium_andersonii.AAC.1